MSSTIDISTSLLSSPFVLSNSITPTAVLMLTSANITAVYIGVAVATIITVISILLVVVGIALVKFYIGHKKIRLVSIQTTYWGNEHEDRYQEVKVRQQALREPDLQHSTNPPAPPLPAELVPIQYATVTRTQTDSMQPMNTSEVEDDVFSTTDLN